MVRIPVGAYKLIYIQYIPRRAVEGFREGEYLAGCGIVYVLVSYLVLLEGSYIYV